MAYSGTIGQTTFPTDKLLSSAVRRCKVPAEQLAGEHWQIARDQLFLLLSDLANEGVPLWCIEKQLYPLYEGQGAITMTAGTVDVLNSFFRTTSEVTGTNTDTATTHTVQFASATEVSTVGIFWNETAALTTFQRSDDGVTWTTVQTETPTASADEVTWFDMESVVPALYFRVSSTTVGTSFTSVHLGNNVSRIPLARLNRDDFTNLPNPAFGSNRVLQFWFDRQTPNPVMRLWPLPNDGALEAQIEVWRHRHIMDVGTLTQEVEVPQRWYEAIVAGLARKLARELIEVDPAVIPMLDKDAASALYVAQQEERDNSPVKWRPNIRMYTA